MRLTNSGFTIPDTRECEAGTRYRRSVLRMRRRRSRARHSGVVCGFSRMHALQAAADDRWDIATVMNVNPTFSDAQACT
jgi:hypothetical protein